MIKLIIASSSKEGLDPTMIIRSKIKFFTCYGIDGVTCGRDLVDAPDVVAHVLVVLEELVAYVARDRLLLQRQLLLSICEVYNE